MGPLKHLNSLSIGSLTFWNLGERVRSWEYQYLLHCVSVSEKHDVLQSFWQLHTDEMLLLEASIFTVSGKKCTIEFQPSADMSWQSWACNEVNQAATSLYANVHKGNMCSMGGSIGHGDKDLWNPYIMNDRENHLSMVDTYLASLPKGLSPSTIHSTIHKSLNHSIMQMNKEYSLLAFFIEKYPKEFGDLFHALDIWHKSVKLTKKLSKVSRTFFDPYMLTLLTVFH